MLRLETDALLALLFQLPPRLTRLDPAEVRTLYSLSLLYFLDLKPKKIQILKSPLRANNHYLLLAQPLGLLFKADSFFYLEQGRTTRKPSLSKPLLGLRSLR